MQSVLEELRAIEARVSALIRRMEAEQKAATATVGEIRRLAILEEVYRKAGRATPEDISGYAIKYGKTPSSCAGYYSGKSPSLAASEDREFRLLTETGNRLVLEAREKWGKDWLDRIPLDIVGNSETIGAEVSF